MTQNYDVAVVGNVGIDTNVYLHGADLEARSLEASIRRGQIAARFTCAQKASSATLITAMELDELFDTEQ